MWAGTAASSLFTATLSNIEEEFISMGKNSDNDSKTGNINEELKVDAVGGDCELECELILLRRPSNQKLLRTSFIGTWSGYVENEFSKWPLLFRQFSNSTGKSRILDISTAVNICFPKLEAVKGVVVTIWVDLWKKIWVKMTILWACLEFKVVAVGKSVI